MQGIRNMGFSLAGAFAPALAAMALSLNEFSPVHTARVVNEGENQIRIEFDSGEWSAGAELKSANGMDFSKAKYLAVDVENLSRTRQARLTMHVSAGVTGGDSDDHAVAIFKKNRSVNTGIGLNPGEKGTMKLLLTHPGVYGAPEGARGPYVIDTAHVTSVQFMLQWPYEDETPDLPDLRVSNLRLEGEPERGRFVPADKYFPFVDRYGQFAHGDWPEKVHSDEDLAGDLASETASLKSAPASWDMFGGWKDGPQLEATGSFRTEMVDGKWWLVTPEGHLFFSVGPDVTRIMTDITDGSKHPSWYEGELPPDGKLPYTIWNLEKKFGRKDFASDYLDFVIKRLDSWGLNTIGNWSAPELGLLSRKPYVASVLERANGVKRHPKFHIYDFTDPDFEANMRAAIRRRFEIDESLKHAARDPMCIGFFVDNELQFQKWIPAAGEDFAAPYIDLYFRLCKEELAKVAPGKLYLGSRFVGFRQPGILWKAAAKYCDVVTVNAYANSVYNISDKMFDKGAEKPILVGEFHFGCYDRGMFKASLAPVWNQVERGRSYERFVEGCLQHPLIVGCHWFQYRDQPLLGRGDGEAYQIGFVDVCDRPYTELCDAARRIGETMYTKRSEGVWQVPASGKAPGKSEAELLELLKSMSLDERIGQLAQLGSGGTAALAESEAFNGPKVPEKVAELVRNGRVGSLLGACGIDNFNALQKMALEESRTKIPLMIGHDMIHGVKTQLPIPLGQSCCWDEELWEKAGRLIALETPLKGANWTFTPMVDIARDPRWGRIAEGGGQDPLLTSRMGAALVRGVQTKDVAMPVAACVKHYAAYGAAIAGRDYNAVEMSESTFRNVYLPPFRACVDAGVLTIMPAFNSLNGVPCSVNKWLLTDLLRGEMGFKGMVISDYDAIGECIGPDHHGVAVDAADAAVKSLAAGMDQEMMSTTFIDTLAQSVREGRIAESVINDRVMNVLRVKNALGLWERPYIDAKAVEGRCDMAAHAAFAREVAAKSCVLLKNEKDTLPLKPGVKVALVGPGGDDLWHTVGTWATWAENTSNATVVEGLKADGVDFEYVKAYDFRKAGVDEAAIKSAAAKADVVIALFGEQGLEAGEGKSEIRIELPEVQLEALKVVKSTGKPLVALMMNGRPMAIPELARDADAILEAWNPGTSGGWGVADVLTGRVNPSGRLTTVIPYGTGQLPLFYNATRTGRPGSRYKNYTSRYIDGEVDPIYTFGYGLSYTTFKYANEKVSVSGGELVFEADVTNVGHVDGIETVQAYTRQLDGEETRPVRELRGWRRVELKSGESAHVVIKAPLSDLDYWCGSRRVRAEGAFHAWVAPNAKDGVRLEFNL